MSILRLSYFNHILIPHWLASEPCDGCGQVDREVNISKALLFNQEGGQILLSLPHRCQCGHHGCAQVTMSILVFGFLLYRAVELDLSKNRKRRGISVRARGTDGLTESLACEFEAIKNIDRNSGSKKQTTPISQSETDEFLKHLDDIDFKPGSESWMSFLRDLGIDPDINVDDA